MKNKIRLGSEKFNHLFDIIKKHDYIDHGDLLYESVVIEGLSERDFADVVEEIYRNFESEAIRDKECSFQKYHINYEGIQFHIMIGQGSAYWTTKQQ